MPSNVIDDFEYRLSNAVGDTANTLADCKTWRDEVRRSYENFTGDLDNLMRSLKFHCDKASSAISYADGIDTEKYKSEYEGLVGRVESI